MNQNIEKISNLDSKQLFETKKSSSEVNAKIILAGEHSVVYGGKALCIPFNSMKMKVTLEKKEHSFNASSLKQEKIKFSKYYHRIN